MPRSVNKTQSKWCIKKYGASKIIDTFETYQGHELQELDDVNLTNITDTATECFLQDIGHVYASDDETGNFSTTRGDLGIDFGGISAHESSEVGARAGSVLRSPTSARPAEAAMSLKHVAARDVMSLMHHPSGGGNLAGGQSRARRESGKGAVGHAPCLA
jgi:hypothetical protein